jgi:uncharacterized protein (TIGR02284 family)
MAERNARAVINHLIETCHDAERGFLTAAEHVRNAEMRRLFYLLADQRHEFVEELLPHADRLGGTAGADGTRIATAHRAWMQLRAHLASNPDLAILAEAARGEQHAQAAYDEVVPEVLPPASRELVEAQNLGVRLAGRLVAALATH